MDVNAAVAALAALVGVCTGAIAVLAFRWSEREQSRPTRSSLHTVAALPPGVDTVLSVLRSSAVVLDESDSVVKASSAAYALGLVRGGRLTVDPMLRMAQDTRRDGEIRQVELDLPQRGSGRGDLLAVSARVAPLGSRLVLLLVEDLTEARRIEAIRRDFVANVSHELKTPVGALSLLSETVMDASDDPEAVQRFAGRMQKEATRLTNLVQELIDLSRVQNDNPMEDSEPVAVEELVGEAIERSRQSATAKHITIAAGGTEELNVWGHRGQLAAALGNLVENAVNYSPPRTRVGIAARRVTEPGGDMIEVAVTDQGIGISDRDKDRIFERFYRVDPARSRATGGTGLGLAIVKHVAASYGGEVTVWSSEGQGSTFTLRLPEAGNAREKAEESRRSRNQLSGALQEPADYEPVDDYGLVDDDHPDEYPDDRPGDDAPGGHTSTLGGRRGRGGGGSEAADSTLRPTDARTADRSDDGQTVNRTGPAPQPRHDGRADRADQSGREGAVAGPPPQAVSTNLPTPGRTEGDAGPGARPLPRRPSQTFSHHRLIAPEVLP